MRRIGWGVGVALFASPLVVAPGAGAATVPTVNGPTSAPYHAVVRLTGTTPDPNSKATIYFRDDAKSPWKAGRTATSDASRRWSTTFTLTHDKSYYASADGLKSAVDTTRLVRATCRTGGSVFHNPLLDREPKSPHGQGIHAALTATRNGLWAGYAFKDYPMEFDAITWRHGQKRPTVLARFPLRGSGNYLPYGHGSLDIAGISPTGTVVAAVQTRLTGDHINFSGYAWRKGRTYHLSASPRWTSVHPVGVTDTGAIIGNVATRGGVAVVRWENAAAPFRVLLPASKHGHYVVSVTARGDVVYDYSTDGGSKIYVLTASGRRVDLVGPDVFNEAGIPFTTGGNRVYGAAGPGGIAYWDLESAPSSGDMSPSGVLVSSGAELLADTAGRKGGLFMIDDRYSHHTRMFYRTQRGAMVRLAPSKNEAGAAVDTAGNLAVTSAKNGTVHFVRCH